jgi:hypothetical protein
LAETRQRWVLRRHHKALLSLLAAGGLVACPGIAAAAQTTADLPLRQAAGNTPVPRDAAAPAPAVDPIQPLEHQVQAMLDVARRQQDEMSQMRQRLAAAEVTVAWLPWLVLALAALGAVAVWLGLRVRRLRRELRRGARLPAPPPRSATAPVASAGGDPTGLPGERSLLAAAGALTPGADAAAQPADEAAGPSRGHRRQTQADEPTLPNGARDLSLGTGVPPRPVSVEELLDLEQQVEFFLVLGQDQAAVDLLLSHVRSTGGANALPYFKLLEIYRQQGDEEAYERTRERFNQRFNACAPNWGGDLSGGRGLADYADVLARLQRAWSQPIRAVAELESLLLRRADLEPFDLPAYREVLMLHALVLDLPAKPVAGPTAMLPHAVQAVQAGDGVDLLLPLDEGPLEITAPRPHLSERTSAQAMLADWVFTRGSSPLPQRAPQPSPHDGEQIDPPAPDELDFDLPSRPGLLDLDLSDYAPAPREFTRPAAFTDIDMRRDSRLSDLAFDKPDTDSPPLSSRH